MEKYIAVMEAMRDALAADPLFLGEWTVWCDDGEGGSPPGLYGQLGHDVGRKRRVLLFPSDRLLPPGGDTKWPLLRGVTLWRSPYGAVWEVDDGNGLVERGSARRLVDAVPQMWRTACDMLVCPSLLTARALKRIVKADEDALAQFGRVCPGPARVKWGAITVCFGAHPNVFYDDERDKVWARETVEASLLAHQAAGVALAMAQSKRRPFRDAERQIPWQDQWSPGDPPAAMRDAASSAKRSEVDGKWRARLQAHLQAETDKARKRRLAVVEKRLKAEVHLPPEGADPTGKEASGWYGATGADRLPVKSEVVAALWVLGFGGRIISEIIVGSRSSKSAMSRRTKELMEGRDDLEAVKGAAVLQRLGLESGLEPRPATAPGAPAGRSKPSVKVKRRGQPPFDVYVDQLDDDTASFVCNLPERALRFVTALYQRGEMSLAETLELLDLSAPKALSGITGSISRWAPVRGVAVPFERVKDGNSLTAYRWIGFPTADAAAPAEDAA